MTNIYTAGVLMEVGAERQRQITEENHTTEKDDTVNAGGQLALAAACYISPRPLFIKKSYCNGVSYMDPWPWNERADRRPANGNVTYHPTDWPHQTRRRLLVMAAALIIAEIERIDRRFFQRDEEGKKANG